MVHHHVTTKARWSMTNTRPSTTGNYTPLPLRGRGVYTSYSVHFLHVQFLHFVLARDHSEGLPAKMNVVLPAMLVDAVHPGAQDCSRLSGPSKAQRPADVLRELQAMEHPLLQPGLNQDELGDRLLKCDVGTRECPDFCV